MPVLSSKQRNPRGTIYRPCLCDSSAQARHSPACDVSYLLHVAKENIVLRHDPKTRSLVPTSRYVAHAYTYARLPSSPMSWSRIVGTRTGSSEDTPRVCMRGSAAGIIDLIGGFRWCTRWGRRHTHAGCPSSLGRRVGRGQHPVARASRVVRRTMSCPGRMAARLGLCRKLRITVFLRLFF